MYLLFGLAVMMMSAAGGFVWLTGKQVARTKTSATARMPYLRLHFIAVLSLLAVLSSTVAILEIWLRPTLNLKVGTLQLIIHLFFVGIFLAFLAVLFSERAYARWRAHLHHPFHRKMHWVLVRAVTLLLPFVIVTGIWVMVHSS